MFRTYFLVKGLGGNGLRETLEMWPETKASAVLRHQVLRGISSLSTAVGDLFSSEIAYEQAEGNYAPIAFLWL